jgi:hypothetical protein
VYTNFRVRSTCPSLLDLTLVSLLYLHVCATYSVLTALIVECHPHEDEGFPDFFAIAYEIQLITATFALERMLVSSAFSLPQGFSAYLVRRRMLRR